MVRSLIPEIETSSAPTPRSMATSGVHEVSDTWAGVDYQVPSLPRQQGLDGVDHLGRIGFGLRPEPADHFPTRCEQELLEVPLHVAGLSVGVGGLGQFGI